MKSTTILAGILCACLGTEPVVACSSIFIPILSGSTVTNVIGARSMDFEETVPLPVLYGTIGDVNSSSVDVEMAAWNNPAKWTNTYNFVGKMVTSTQAVDGINSAGVYVGELFLPNITSYPTYPVNAKPALAVFDVVNYILGTSGNVAQALSNLAKVQVVLSTLHQTLDSTQVFPLHLHIIDKTGAAAVIEYIGGVMQITTTGNLSVMTNSPDIAWQQANYANLVASPTYYNHNNPNYTVTADSITMFMNGSGHIGAPGDSMPPSRYVRLRTIVDGYPPAATDTQAYYETIAAMYAGAFTPISYDNSPTLWSTLYNLTKLTYTVTNYISAAATSKYIATDPASLIHQNTYNLNSTDHSGQHHAIIAQVPSTMVISTAKAQSLMSGQTPAAATYVSTLINPK